jgi:hypothetical protein
MSLSESARFPRFYRIRAVKPTEAGADLTDVDPGYMTRMHFGNTLHLARDLHSIVASVAVKC